MASQETQQLDNIIASRRAMILGGGAVALAAALLPPTAKAASTVSNFTDADILNFALNLEYLEANFYYLAAFGTTINTPNAAVTAAGGVQIPITGVGAQGAVVAPAVTKVPFAVPYVAGYAVETAVEEGKHVLFLQKALGSAAVAQPQIDLNTSFNTLAMAAGIAPTFNPYASDATFLIGAYIFEDVGVTAYSGAAPLISTTTAGKANLQAAASILAVEAYHAGMIRTTINALDPTNALGYIGITQKISALRASLSKAVAPTSPAYPDGTYGDDVPLTTNTTYSLGGGTAVNATTIVDASQTNVIGFSRNTTQVLNIVTGGGAMTSGAKATGVFFPNGLNGLFT
ncbi:MAG TPA: ferritin-like domain-containing protein [Bryocella sp.]|nr:ferritin-like domain-containing protein [Bryocella sp.]